MIDVTKIRHRSPVNNTTTKLSYICNYADDEMAFEMLEGDICLWGKLKYHLWQYEMYGVKPSLSTNNPDDIKVKMLFDVIALKLDQNAEVWKASCIKNKKNREGKAKNEDSP